MKKMCSNNLCVFTYFLLKTPKILITATQNLNTKLFPVKYTFFPKYGSLIVPIDSVSGRRSIRLMPGYTQFSVETDLYSL